MFRRCVRSAPYLARGKAETVSEAGSHAGAETWDRIAAIREKWERELGDIVA